MPDSSKTGESAPLNIQFGTENVILSQKVVSPGKMSSKKNPRTTRLTLEVARNFFCLHDMLGYDKASKTIEWLLFHAKSEIQKFSTVNPNLSHDLEHDLTQHLMHDQQALNPEVNGDDEYAMPDLQLAMDVDDKNSTINFIEKFSMTNPNLSHDLERDLAQHVMHDQQALNPEVNGDQYTMPHLELGVDVDDSTINFIERNGEKIFAAINLLLELPSAILEQLSSKHKHQMALTLMLLSFVALVICIIELVYIGRRSGWKWRTTRQIYSFSNVVGFTCAICQCIFTSINYALVLRHVNTQIQIAVMPIIFAFVQLCSTFRANSSSNKTQGEAEEQV